MKITKRQLRRIIKEEKARLLSETRNKNVEEGIARGVINGVWDWIEEEFSQDMIGEDFMSSPAYVESIAYALETVCLLYTSPSPRDGLLSRMPSSA